MSTSSLIRTLIIICLNQWSDPHISNKFGLTPTDSSIYRMVIQGLGNKTRKLSTCELSVPVSDSCLILTTGYFHFWPDSINR